MIAPVPERNAARGVNASTIFSGVRRWGESHPAV
jgi:hypothetical protein